MTSYFVTAGGPSAGKRYSLGEECVLGRSFKSDIYVGDLNVSRRHARVWRDDDGHYLIEDLGSGNGTFVNTKQVKKVRLAPQDIIRVGGSNFRYETTEAEPRRWAQQVMTVLANVVLPDTGEVRFDPATTAQIEAVALEQEDVSRIGADRALKMLESMYAVTDVIASELDLDKLLQKVLDHLFAVLPQAERGFILLVDPDTERLIPEAVKQRVNPEKAPVTASGALTYSRTIVDQVLLQGQGVIRSADAEAARPARMGPPIPAMVHGHGAASRKEVPRMGAPLVCGKKKLGTLHLEGVPGGESFSQDDLDLLSGIARQAALAISNARAGQTLVQHERLKADLEMARQIQQSFLPKHLPAVHGLEFDSHYRAASHVGGDFYDVIETSPTRIGILVGDVSGHGVAAALMMAHLTTAIRIFSRTTSAEPSAVLTDANRALLETEQDAIFATVLFILLDLEQKTFTIANAGHQPPMVSSSRFEGISELDDATAVALGVLPGTVYPQEVYQLVPGDVVLLYTDGINEALDREQEEYGMARLKEVVTSGAAEPKALVRRVMKDLSRFVDGAKQIDDQTLLAFGIPARRTGEVQVRDTRV
ncbi:MAG: SpoIIE family protein phosphatase [Deltaproteobacteria bacterium]|nr:SpoIIE family protein phosphatase [Deltaproteobacteria bacterium]